MTRNIQTEKIGANHIEGQNGLIVPVEIMVLVVTVITIRHILIESFVMPQI